MIIEVRTRSHYKYNPKEPVEYSFHTKKAFWDWFHSNKAAAMCSHITINGRYIKWPTGPQGGLCGIGARINDIKYHLNKFAETDEFWSDFGVLKNIENDGSLIIITNEDGDQRKMSLRKYGHFAKGVEARANILIGQPVMIITSQKTNNWSTEVWFYDLVKKV